MRLDHVSYVASHDQISDVVQRIGSQIGTAFVDGGIHPRFGTRNFTAPLENGQYIEVVCALDHPAAEQSAFGKAVTKKVNEGGGWLTWVFSVENIEAIEKLIGRDSLEGHRRRPDGTDLRWKQIGVKELLTNPELPFFIEWQDGHHPSEVGTPVSRVLQIEFAEQNPILTSTFSSEIFDALNSRGIEIVVSSEGENGRGISCITLETPNGIVKID